MDMLKNPFESYTLIPKSEENLISKYPEYHHTGTNLVYPSIFTPNERKRPEFVFINREIKHENKDVIYTNDFNAIDDWNNEFEFGYFRHQLFKYEIPEDLKWIKKFGDSNLYLFDKRHDYKIYNSLYHLLPLKIRKYHKLPLLRADCWPVSGVKYELLKKVFNYSFKQRLSRAFATYIFSFILKGKYINSFSKSEPLSILAHDLNFWLPHVFALIEEKLDGFERSRFFKPLDITQEEFPGGTFLPQRKAGYLWKGESEAIEFTQQLILKINKDGVIDKIIECVRSNRIIDDFSPIWSHVKEDFERKLYSKRNKIKIKFVEISQDIPIHSHETEVDENILWNNFLGLVNEKERKVVLLLRKGITNHKEISEELGYANHTPVTKMIGKIRNKAKIIFKDSFNEHIRE